LPVYAGTSASYFTLFSRNRVFSFALQTLDFHPLVFSALVFCWQVAFAWLSLSATLSTARPSRRQENEGKACGVESLARPSRRQESEGQAKRGPPQNARRNHPPTATFSQQPPTGYNSREAKPRPDDTRQQQPARNNAPTTDSFCGGSFCGGSSTRCLGPSTLLHLRASTLHGVWMPHSISF
jgi:hypothetical protein